LHEAVEQHDPIDAEVTQLLDEVRGRRQVRPEFDGKRDTDRPADVFDELQVFRLNLSEDEFSSSA
jgi:hypothetical protein